ncbi:serine O-acetyltransferase [Escherichia coli]
MSCEELEIVWNNIKAEARTLADCEPMLASFYHATLLKHENLGSALSYMLANKLSSPIMPAIAIREVVEEAYAADPEMIASAACDIQAVRTRDRHPKIREGVMIGAGAKILGNIEVGRGAKIGAGSVVLQPVPPHTTAAGVPARIVGKPDSDKPSMDMDQHFNGINHTFEYGDGI